MALQMTLDLTLGLGHEAQTHPVADPSGQRTQRERPAYQSGLRAEGRAPSSCSRARVHDR
jgi:hypothetical protein